MFDALSQRLDRISSSLRNKGRISAKDLDDALGEIRAALLDADVELSVVRGFLDGVRGRCELEALSKSLTPGQQVVKAVNDELIAVLGGEPLKKQIVFGPFPGVPSPVRQIVLINGRGVWRRGDEKAHAPQPELVPHRFNQRDRVGDALVAEDEAGALPYRLLAEIEHPSVAADEDRIVAHPKHRLSQILVRPDERLPESEMIAEIGVQRRGQSEPVLAGPRRSGSRGKPPAFFEDRSRTVRPDEPYDQRRGQKQKG